MLNVIILVEYIFPSILCCFTEGFVLVYWPEEESTSVLSCQQIKSCATLTVGASCIVKIGKKEYDSCIAGIGKLLIRL